MKKKTITVFLTALVAMNTMAGCASTTPKEKEEKTEISKEEKSETDAETVSRSSRKSCKHGWICYRNAAGSWTGRSYCRLCMAG